MIATYSDQRPPVPPKTTLFCPHCDHESPIDDDWRVRERAGRVVYECPACDAAVTVRGSPPVRRSSLDVEERAGADGG